MSLEAILEQLKKNYAVIYPGLSEDFLQNAHAFLKKAKKTDLPDDFAVFLKLSNGLDWNGFELFPLTQRDSEDRTFKHPGLISYNLKNVVPVFSSLLIVGRACEELIAFDPKDACYKVFDRYLAVPISVFSSLEEVIRFYARDVLEK